MSKIYTYEEFLEIIASLRSENGCPWDKIQTHESLKPCMMEEAAELLASIRIFQKTGDAENMKEELGDILLQVVMHSQIAKEEGLFSMEDVINEVACKMVRRHPHVFGDVEAETAGQVLANWDEIKKKEKEGKHWVESPLREISQELPSLTRAPKVLKKIDKLYEQQSNGMSVIAQMEASLNKLKDQLVNLEVSNLEQSNSEQSNSGVTNPEIAKSEMEHAIGDLLMAISSLGYQNKLSLEQILTDRVEDLIEKFEGLPIE